MNRLMSRPVVVIGFNVTRYRRSKYVIYLFVIHQCRYCKYCNNNKNWTTI